jgi:fructose-bisphosphate aldolase, class II
MITLKEALTDAQRRGNAIGHFNVSEFVGLKAVTGAAKKLNVPVLVGTSEGERDFLGVHEIVDLVRSFREQLEHPISSTPITLIRWNVLLKRRKQATT